MPWRWVARAAVVAVVAGGLVAVVLNEDSRIDDAQEIVNDDARFETATSSALALGRVSTLLKREAQGCSGDEAYCRALFSAAAWAQITAVDILECSRPGVFRARRAMREHLEALESDPPPEGLPDLIACREHDPDAEP